MTQKRKSLRSVAVIPCYNEERNIRMVTQETLKYVDNVIIVDDGCTDQTIDRISDLPITIVAHESNQGKGVALRTGFSQAIEDNYDIIITLDGDGQHEPKRIPEFIDELLNRPTHIVLGSRFLGVTKHMPWLRKFTNGFTNTVMRTLFRVPVSDTQSGYRAFRKIVLEHVDTNEPRFVMETEILIEAHRLGFTISEIFIPTLYGVGEDSKMVPTREAKEWLIMASRKLFERPSFQKIKALKKYYK